MKPEILNIVEIFNWLRAYIFYGGLLPIVAMIFIGFYFKGMQTHFKILREKKKSEFSTEEQKNGVPYFIFVAINKGLDCVMDYPLNFLKKTVWQPFYELFEAIVSDKVIAKVFKRLGADVSIKNRIAVAEVEFNRNDNAFWWSRRRGPAFRNESPIISGKWFNGKSPDQYLSFLVPEKSIFKCVRVGFIVFIFSFLSLTIINRPQTYLGWLGNHKAAEIVRNTSTMIANDPGVIPELRKDMWSAEEEKSVKTQAFDASENKALQIVSNAQGYNYYFFGFIFKNGLMTDLLLSMLCGIYCIRRLYNHYFSLLKIPYIKDSHEDFLYEKNKGKIASFKTSIAAANISATGYDKKSAVFKLWVSTGEFMRKGLIGGKRKFARTMMSVMDFSKNLIAFGATGGGKSELVVKPMVMNLAALKNETLKQNKDYEELFDLRINRLTNQAIKVGYLNEYKPLPHNPLSVGLTIMDSKAQLYKDLFSQLQSLYLHEEFIVFGAKEELGQYAIDVLASIGPNKLIDILKSLKTQMGGGSGEGFFEIFPLEIIRRIANVAYVFARTRAGHEYMKKNKMKIWSLSFIFELVAADPKNYLLTQALFSIYEDIQFCPERLSDVLTPEVVSSINYLLNDWQEMVPETKTGLQANISMVMSPYNNSALRTFMTGVGANMRSISDIYGSISAFDLSTTEYQIGGKLIQLICKTLIMEEAVGRQVRFNSKILELNHFFTEAYPELTTYDSSIECVPLNWYTSTSAREHLQDFLIKIDEILVALNKHNGEADQVSWSVGSYTTNLKKIVNAFTVEPSISDINSPFTAAVLKLANEAIYLSDCVRRLESRIAKEHVGIAAIDPMIFKANETDSTEVKEKKREHLGLYYEYMDAKERIGREHLYFIADEYQELITLDKDGTCYTDFNFLNVGRSTNTKMFVLTQSPSGLEQRIGKEETINFLNQFRNKLLLSTEDDATRETTVKLCGRIDMFDSVEFDSKLKNSTDDYFIYDNLTAYITDLVEKNKDRQKNGHALVKEYPYLSDIFADGEAINLDDDNFKFKNSFSSIYERNFDLTIPSMKKHFKDDSGVHNLEESGSSSDSPKNNLTGISDSLNSVKKNAADKYDSYLKDGYKKDSELLSDTEFRNQSNAHAVFMYQQSGMSVIDHVILAPENYLLEEVE